MMTNPNSMFRFLFITTMTAGIVITLAFILNGTEALAQNDTLDLAKGQRNGSIEQNKALVESAIKEIFNQRNVSTADKYIAEDLINHNPNAGQGREPLKQYFDKVYFTAFPDSQTTIEQMLGEGDLVLVFLNWTGTHDGEFFGKQPTNKEVSMRTAHIFRIEDDMIAEQWEIADQLDLLRQTGVIAFN